MTFSIITASLQILSILTSFASLNVASGKLFFTQRGSNYFYTDPPIRNIIFISPLIAAMQFGYLAAWIFLAAYLKVYVFVCALLILGIYVFTLEALILDWKPVMRDFENEVLVDKYLKNISIRKLDISHLFFTAVFTALVSPCTVWYEPTKPLFKLQEKLTLAKIFLPLSNLLIVSMLSISIFSLVKVNSFEITKHPPLTFCFQTEYSSNISLFYSVKNLTVTSEARNALDLCNLNECYPAVRICGKEEGQNELFFTSICPVIIVLLFLSFLSSLLLSYLSNYDNLFECSKILHLPIVHPVLLQNYLKTFDFYQEEREERIKDLIKSAGNEVLNFFDPLTGDTCLHAAFQGMKEAHFTNEKIDIAFEIIRRGGEIDSKNNAGKSFHSILSETKKVLKNIKEKNSSNNGWYDEISHNSRYSKLLAVVLDSKTLNPKENNFRLKSKLESALNQNKLSALKQLYHLGCNLNTRNEQNLPPLLVKLKELETSMPEPKKRNKIIKICVFILKGEGSSMAKNDSERRAIYDFIMSHVIKNNIKLKPEKLYNLLIWSGIKFINAQAEFQPFLEYLIKIGCKIDLPNNYTSDHTELNLLQISCKSGNRTSTEFFVKNGANINQKDIFGQTPLNYAVKNRFLDVVSCLVENGADVNVRDYDGKTALHLVHHNWNLEFAEKLISNHGDVNVADKFGMTPLHYAAKHQQEKIVDLLIKKSANVFVKDRNGKTPLHALAENRSSLKPRNGRQSCRLLLEKTENEFINFRDNLGKTSLHYSAEALLPDPDVVELLIESSADVNVVDVFGKTPLQYAEVPIVLHSDPEKEAVSRRGRERIKYLLINAGAGGFTPASRFEFQRLVSASKSLISCHKSDDNETQQAGLEQSWKFSVAGSEEFAHKENPNYIKIVKDNNKDIIELIEICWLCFRKRLGKHPPGRYRTSIRLYVDHETYWPRSSTLSMAVNKIEVSEEGNIINRTPILTEDFPSSTWKEMANGTYQGKQSVVADPTSDNWHFVYLDSFAIKEEEQLEFELKDILSGWKRGMKWDYIELFLLDIFKPCK
jgi:ankyrin repeat protein